MIAKVLDKIAHYQHSLSVGATALFKHSISFYGVALRSFGMATMTFTYLFDPLCGWCYAAAPAIKALREAELGNIAMAPVGLFYNPRPTSDIADFAKTNDERIQSLSGQEFSDAYFENVLQKPDGVFSSRALTLATLFLETQQLGLAGELLHTAQIRRYVEGIDTSDTSEVANIAKQVAAEQGIEVDSQALAELLQDGSPLQQQADQMVQQASQLLSRLPGSGGVPQLIMTNEEGQNYIFSGADLYQGAEGFLGLVNTVQMALSGEITPEMMEQMQEK